MLENKGDEVLCTEKGRDQRTVMKTGDSRRAASTLEVVWDCVGLTCLEAGMGTHQCPCRKNGCRGITGMAFLK